MSNEPEIIPPAQRGQMAFQPLEFSADQVELIKRMHSAAGLTNDEFMAFMHFCKRKRVDPLLKQAYAMKRRMKDGTSVVTVMTSIEGLRAIADRTHEYCPGNEPEFIHDAKGKLEAAKVSVKKFVRGEWHELKGVAYFSEFDQGNFMWQKMPKNQLAKCAEAQALRKGWPEDCGGFYVPEEFNQEPEDAPKPKERERGAIGKLSKSKEDNRGHGNEGIKEAMAEPPKEERKPTAKRPFDQYTTSITKALLRDNTTKQWIELTVKGGTANIWNESAMAFKEENVPATIMYCWHQSLFEALLLKPQKIVLTVSNKEGSRFSPIVEDILAVNEVKYEKGKPYVAPEVGNLGNLSSVSVPTETPSEDDKIARGAATSLPPQQTADAKWRRTESLLELTQAFEKLWPVSNLAVRPMRNNVGKALLNVQSKDQLADLNYPQENIDASIKALQEFAKMEPKATTEEGALKDIVYLFNKARGIEPAVQPEEEGLFA